MVIAATGHPLVDAATCGSQIEARAERG